MKQPAFPASRWVVEVRFTDPRSGAEISIVQHECRDLGHARSLLSEIGELASDLAELLPGLSAIGYELCEPVRS